MRSSTSLRQGYEAALFIFDCKAELDRQRLIGQKVLAIETEFWKHLVEATKFPTEQYDKRWSYCMVPIMEAILKATNKHPGDEEVFLP